MTDNIYYQASSLIWQIIVDFLLNYGTLY